MIEVSWSCQHSRVGPFLYFMSASLDLHSRTVSEILTYTFPLVHDQIFFDIDESSKLTAEELCNYLEEHGIHVMQESSSRSVLPHKKHLRVMNPFVISLSLFVLVF